jgi:hypothetical protein
MLMVACASLTALLIDATFVLRQITAQSANKDTKLWMMVRDASFLALFRTAKPVPVLIAAQSVKTTMS